MIATNMLSIGLKGLEAIIILHFSSSVIQVSKVETELNQKSQSAKKSAILAQVGWITLLFPPLVSNTSNKHMVSTIPTKYQLCMHSYEITQNTKQHINS
jgi:hypothetical protein